MAFDDDTPDAAARFRPLTRADGVPEWHSPPTALPRDPLAETFATASLPWPEPEVVSLPAPATTDRSRLKMFAVVGMVAGAFMLTVVAGGAWMAYRMLLGHEDRATAAYAPADAWVYGALNTDPTSHAWKDAWELAKRVGLDDELSALPERGLEDSGEDPDVWDQYIRPAVGREVGFAIWPDPDAVEIGSPRGAVIIMISNDQKAREAIDLLLEDETPDQRSYRDVTYQLNDSGEAVGIVDEALVAAASAEAFEDVVDAHLDGALDTVEPFNGAADRAAADPLLFVYADSAAIAETLDDIDQLASAGPVAQFGQPFDGYDDLGRVTVTIKADDGALRIVTLTEGRPDSYPMTPAGDAFASQIPADTLFYIASSDLYETIFAPMVVQLEGLQTDGIPAPDVDDLEDELGIEVVDGLLVHLTGGWAMSANAEQDEGSLFGYEGGLHFFSAVDDANAVLNTLDQLAGELEAQGAPIERTNTGFRIDEMGVAAVVAVEDDVLRIDVDIDSSAANGTLADDASYRRAMASMPDGAVMTGYVALDRLLDLVPDDIMAAIDPEAREALEALGPLAWVSAPDGAGTRTDVVLIVNE